MEGLHNKIKMLRHSKGQIQEDVAKLLRISVPAYSKMETGATDLNYSRIVQIAELYGLTPSQLLDPGHSPMQKNDTDVIAELNSKLSKKDEQISALQSKLIELYNELHP